MKPIAVDPTSPDTSIAGPTRRRSLLLGAGAAGAAVIAAKAIPLATTQVVSAPTGTVTDASAGYRLTQHVLRYYETIKV